MADSVRWAEEAYQRATSGTPETPQERQEREIAEEKQRIRGTLRIKIAKRLEKVL